MSATYKTNNAIYNGAWGIWTKNGTITNVSALSISKYISNIDDCEFLITNDVLPVVLDETHVDLMRNITTRKMILDLYNIFSKNQYYYASIKLDGIYHKIKHLSVEKTKFYKTATFELENDGTCTFDLNIDYQPKKNQISLMLSLDALDVELNGFNFEKSNI